jgi:hypothetical protein
MSTMSTPTHLRPESCHVCGHGPHRDGTADGGHAYWSIAEADREIRRVTALESRYNREAAFVAQHRPY